MAAVIEFRNAGVTLGGRVILRDLSFAVGQGETVALLGRSGSGKTTALKLVNGLLAPSSGTVLVDARPTTDWDPVRLKRSIGYVIQDAGLFPHFPVRRNVGLVPELEGWEAERIEARVRELLALVGLDAGLFGSRYPRQLSGGQRQRVGVARALAADPRVLLFDEPFGALDPVTRSEIQREFIELVRRLEKTVLFVTHDVREALKVASRVALIHEGRLAVLATPTEFVRDAHPETQAFLRCID